MFYRLKRYRDGSLGELREPEFELWGGGGVKFSEILIKRNEILFELAGSSSSRVLLY